MSRSATRLNSLFSRKRSEATRKNPRRRSKLRNRIASNWSQVESLESRAMLAVTATFLGDFVGSETYNVNPAPGASHTYTHSNTFGTVEVVLDGDEDVYVHRLNGAWSFYTDPLLTEESRIAINLLAQGISSSVPSWGGDSSHTILDGASISMQLPATSVTSNPTAPATPVTTDTPKTVSMEFESIVFRSGTNAVTPSVFFVGGSSDFTKQIYIDFRSGGDFVPGGYVYVGSPIDVDTTTAEYGNRTTGTLAGDRGFAEGGGIYLAASKVDINANVTVPGGAVLRTGLPTDDVNYGVGSDDYGMFIRRAVSVEGGGANFHANGADVRILAGGSIADGAGALGSVVGELVDADLYVTGTLAATDMQLLLRGSELETNTQTRIVTTRAADTGIQTGLLSGARLIMSLNNQLDDTAVGADGEVDIRTDFDNIRIATGLAGASLDYGITIQNVSSLALDSVMSSEGDIDIEATSGTITLLAAIDTNGAFSLSATGAGADLTVGSAITSGKSVSLTAADALVTSAAIIANEGGTDTGIVSLAGNTVTVNSLVQGASGVEIEAATNILQGAASTSLVRGGLATLVAGGSISLNTEIGELVASAGASVAIVDQKAARDADTVNEMLLSNIVGGGVISITADQSISALSVVGQSNATILSNRGDIVLGAVSLPVAGLLTIQTPGYEDEDDLDENGDLTEILGGSISLAVPGELPAVRSIDWTAYNVPVDDFYSDIPTVAATLLGSGNIAIDSSGSITVTRAVTTDGSVSVKASGSITINGAGITTALDDELGAGGETAGITVESTGASVSVGPMTVGDAGAQVTVTAAQGITATDLITANFVTLEAGSLADIGSSSARVNVAGLTVLDLVSVTVEAGADNVFLGNSSALQLAAQAASKVDVLGTGSFSSITIDNVVVTSESGQVVIDSDADVSVNSVVVAAGAFDEDSSISLSAGRYLINGNDPIDLQAYALILSASTFNGDPAGAGYFNVKAIDAATRVSAAATGAAGQINLEFERDADLELGAFSANGNITISLAEQTAGDAVPTLIIGAGGIAAAGTSVVSLESDGAIRNTEDATVTPGILAGNTVSLTASGGEIDVFTQAALLAADGSGDVTIRQTGSVQVAAGNVVAADSLSLSVIGNGSIAAGPGVIQAQSATLSVQGTGTISAKTAVDTLVASSGNRAITIVESNGLTLGSGGINAGSGDVKVTLTAGNLSGAGELITGGGVALKLLAAGDLDVDTEATTLSASTANGTITLRNTRTFAVGADGIVAGDGAGGFKNVSLESTGGVNTGAGVIKADGLEVVAAGAVGLTTTVSTVSVTASTGAVTVAQRDAALTIEGIVTTAGGVTVTSNKAVTVEEISAGGSASAVSLTTTGTGEDIVLSNDLAIVTTGAVTLTASGDIDGTRDEYSDPGVDADPVADIVGGSVALQANGGAIDTTVNATGRLTAKTLGANNDILLTLIGTRPVIVGTGTTHTSLSATGDIQLRAVNSTVLDENEKPTGNDIVVLAQPTIGAGGTVTFDTLGDVVHAVTNASALTVDGSLSKAVANVTASPNANVLGGTSVAFATTVNSPISLTSTLAFAAPIVIDGTRRIDTSSGTFRLGRRVDFDGARLSGASLSGLSFGAGADASVIRGLAFTNFNRAGGAAVSIDGADDIEIRNSSFGVTSAGRVARNQSGISVANAAGTIVDSNTIVMSTGAGIQLGADVDGTEITNNFIGTDATRRSYGNAVGIDVTGAGSDGITIDGNFVATNATAGIRVASDATNVDISDNEVVVNGVGIEVGGTAGAVTLTGNTVTRNTSYGVRVTGAATNVAIGGTDAADRNYIGTTASGSAGLGNRLDGIRIDSTGTGIDVVNNLIANNGQANRIDENNGLSIAAATPNVDVTSNIVSGNRGNGIRVSLGTATITKNRVFSNLGSGIQTAGAATVTIGGSATANNTESLGNQVFGNTRYGLDLGIGVTAAALSGNSLTGNRMGGINGVAVTPVITSATYNAGTQTLTVTFNASVAMGTQVHLYLGNGTGTTSQGATYVGRVSGAGSATVTLALGSADGAGSDRNSSILSLVRVGAPITATLTTGGIVSRFANNFVLRSA